MLWHASACCKVEWQGTQCCTVMPRSLLTWIISKESCLLYFKFAATPMYVSGAKRLNTVVETLLSEKSYALNQDTLLQNRTKQESMVSMCRFGLWAPASFSCGRPRHLGSSFCGQIRVQLFLRCGLRSCTRFSSGKGNGAVPVESHKHPFQPFRKSTFFWPPIWSS